MMAPILLSKEANSLTWLPNPNADSLSKISDDGHGKNRSNKPHARKDNIERKSPLKGEVFPLGNSV